MENFTNYLAIKLKMSVATVQIYNELIAVFEKWLIIEHLKANELGKNDLINYLKYLQKIGKSEDMQRRSLTVLRHYYSYLIELEVINFNPALSLNLKKAIRTVANVPLSLEDLTTLYQKYKVKINSPNHLEYKIVIGLLVYQALRVKEIVDLKITDIDLNEAIITLPKKKRINERILKLEGVQIAYLQQFISLSKPKIHLFPNSRKEEQIKHGYYYSLILRLKKINPNLVNAQHIRQSVIAHWTKLYDIRIVQYRSGHKYISSVQRYDQVSLETLQAEIDQLHPLNTF